MRIAICHQTFSRGDAIGNDILGMCRTLKACGHTPFVLCEADPHNITEFEVSRDFTDTSVGMVDMVVYHHSQDWKLGARFLERSTAPVVFKYHNITPARFFDPFASEYAARCRVGVELTRAFVRFPRPHHWLCASSYNREELLALGVRTEQCTVAAPFNQVDALLEAPNHASTEEEVKRFLSVGRFAPNKGHLALLDFCTAYRSLYGKTFEMVIAGAIDPVLKGYWQTFVKRVQERELEDSVRVYPHLSHAALRSLFQTSHIYLVFSEHEGFCVPIVEAQAVGLPVVGSGVGAVRETAGRGQFIGAHPGTTEEFEYFATLANTASTDASVRGRLVENGRRNVFTRFANDVTENAFLEPLLPWLCPSS